MARAAQEAVVLEAAFSTAISHRNDVIRFPTGTSGAPGFSRRTVRDRRLRSCPLSVGLHDVETTDLADALVTLLHPLTNVPGTAADFPLVDAGVAAERASRSGDRPATPATDWLAGRVALRFSPVLGRDASASARTRGRHIGNVPGRRYGWITRPTTMTFITTAKRRKPATALCAATACPLSAARFWAKGPAQLI